MSNIIKIALSSIICVFLFGSSVCALTGPAEAGPYVGNFERIPLIENRPPQVGHWSKPPAIIVCEQAPISEIQIRSAVNFWKRLGYKFGNTQYKYDPLNKCLSDEPKGYIILHLVTKGVKLEETAIAQTRFYIDNATNEISWAIIYVRSDEIRATIVEHELGHALGFLHYNVTNHLMNSKWTMGGWDKEGLENRPR